MMTRKWSDKMSTYKFPFILGVCGKMGSGKTTFANCLLHALRKAQPTSTSKIFSFGSCLKKVVAFYYDPNGDFFSTEGKATILPTSTKVETSTAEFNSLFYPCYTDFGSDTITKLFHEVAERCETERVYGWYSGVLTRGRMLQIFGSTARRILGADVWVNVLIAQVRAANIDYAIIDDVRYLNEAENIVGNFGILLDLKESCDMVGLVTAKATGRDPYHESEWWDGQKFPDSVIIRKIDPLDPDSAESIADSVTDLKMKHTTQSS